MTHLHEFGLANQPARDMHAYIFQCNGRQYGDSRIRTSFEDSWQCHLLRVKSGISDYCAVGEVDEQTLRAFQRSHYSPVKPVPDGIEMDCGRKVLWVGDKNE